MRLIYVGERQKFQNNLHSAWLIVVAEPNFRGRLHAKTHHFEMMDGLTETQI